MKAFALLTVVGTLLAGAAALVAWRDPGREEASQRARDAERARARLEAAIAVDRAFAKAVRSLESLAEEAANAYVDDTSAPGKGDADSEQATAWTQIQGLVAGAAGLPGARVVLYDEPGKPNGYATAQEGVHSVAALASWTGRAPDSVLRGEFARAKSPTAPSEALVWFTSEPGGGVRLHFLEAYLHSYESERASESVDVPRLVEASAPFLAPEGVALRVRCDVAAGQVAGDPPFEAAKGARTVAPGDVVVEAIHPEVVLQRWPSGARVPRANGSVPDPAPTVAARARLAPPLAVLALLGAALLASGAAVLLGVRARPASRAAPDVTAETAHELKTPLTAMRGELEVALRRERTPEEYRTVLAACLEEVKGLQSLVSQVLLLTRGANAPRADEAVDLASVLKAEVERVRAAAKDRAVSFEVPAGPVTVRGDPSLLARAAGNLLDNAVLHSVAGGAVRATIATASGAAVVAVEDDGPGIPDARREKVFERFWRGPEVGQRGIPGAGLGLPIARWIAESHGGTLVLDPAVTGRARFVLRLPLESS